MGREKIVNDLYKFLKEDVTVERLFEADNVAYGDVLNEGKLPADTSVATPDQIQPLAEEKEDKESKDTAENPEIKTDNAGVTPEPEETKVSADLDKQTPNVDKLTQDKDGKDPLIEPDKVKEEKKEEVKVTDVKKEKTENEGKLPADTSVATPDQIQQLAESGEDIFTVSNEQAAKKIQAKFPNSRYEQNTEGTWTVYVSEKKECEKCKGKKCECVIEKTKGQQNAWKVSKASHSDVFYVATADEAKEDFMNAYYPDVDAKKAENIKSSLKVEDVSEKVNECPTIAAAKAEEVPDVKAAKTDEVDKLKKESVEAVKEDVDVTIKTDDKEVSVISADGSTQVTTLDTAVPAPMPSDILTTEEPELEEPEYEDVFATETAEKFYVADYLAGMKSLTEKQSQFLVDMKAKKMSKKNKEKVSTKLTDMKKKEK